MRIHLILFVLLAGLLLTTHAAAQAGIDQCDDQDSDATPIHRTAPAFPHPARMLCLEGTVIIEFTVGVDGLVSNVEVLSAQPEGIFEQAAIQTTDRWLYQPRCVDGQAVEHQQKTAIDFELEEGVKAGCVDAAKKLKGEHLEFASAMGSAYSLLAELFVNPDSQDILKEMESALQPQFQGDLGKVERFHQGYIRTVLDDFEKTRNPSSPADLMSLVLPGNKPITPDDEITSDQLQSLRDASLSRIKQFKAQAQKDREAYAALHDATSMDPDLLTLLVEAFAGSFNHQDELVRQLEMVSLLINEMYQVLSDTKGHWTVAAHGIHFEFADDQREFHSVLDQVMELRQDAHEQVDEIWRGYAGYRR